MSNTNKNRMPRCVLPRLILTWVLGVNFPFSSLHIRTKMPFLSQEVLHIFFKGTISGAHRQTWHTRCLPNIKYEREKKDGIYYARVWACETGDGDINFILCFSGGGKKGRGHTAKNGFLCVHICYKLMPNRQKCIFQREQRNWTKYSDWRLIGPLLQKTFHHMPKTDL